MDCITRVHEHKSTIEPLVNLTTFIYTLMSESNVDMCVCSTTHEGKECQTIYNLMSVDTKKIEQC